MSGAQAGVPLRAGGVADLRPSSPYPVLLYPRVLLGPRIPTPAT
nr:MAG TPA: hypothetical protein [Caudoviricetes sp.]